MEKDKDSEEYEEVMKSINELSMKIIQPKDIKLDGFHTQLKGLSSIRGNDKTATIAALLFNSLKNKKTEEKSSTDF